MRQRIMDRVTGRNSDRHATTLVIQRASLSPNDDARRAPNPNPNPPGICRRRCCCSRAERRASAGRRTPRARPARCAGRRRRGPASSTVAPPLARLAADARNPEGKEPARPRRLRRVGVRAETREDGCRVRAEPRRARDRGEPRRAPTARERPGHCAPARRAPSFAASEGAPMGSAAGVATPVPGRLAERHSARSPRLGRLDFRAGQRHLRDALSGVRGDAGVHPVIRRGVHLRRRRETSSGDAASVAMASSKCVRPLAASCETSSVSSAQTSGASQSYLWEHEHEHEGRAAT